VAAPWTPLTLDASEKSALPVSPIEYREKNWYAVATSPRHEKWVAQQMKSFDIECFLPAYKSLRRWKDRRKELELPLFPGYLFVRIALQHRLSVLRIPGVSQMVGTQGKPSALPEHEIQALRNGLSSGLYAESVTWLKVGRKVCVQRGPLAGARGILVRKKQNCRIVISIDAIMRSVALEIDEADVQPIS
jgi:transcription antitermination factor NusG